MVEIKDLYWLAGLLEGEGCFSTANAGKDVCIDLSMTDKDVVYHAQKVTGGLGHVYGPYKRRGKSIWTWRVSHSRDAAALMMTLYPLMWNRRQERIEDLLELWKAKRDPALICINGHRKEGTNLYINSNGVRCCRECRKGRYGQRA